MKAYVKYLICFLLGGVISGYLVFNYQSRTLLGMADINLMNSYAKSGEQSINIIENINNKNFDQAIYDLEFNISTAKLILSDCENCSTKQKNAFEKVSKYRFTKFPDNEINP